MLCLALVLMSACTPFHPPKEQEAVALVWDFFGGTRRPPSIVWKRGESLDCGEGGRGFYRDLTVMERNAGVARPCVVGVFWEERYEAQVAWSASSTFGNSALAHELYHAHMFNKHGHGKGDANHEDPGFADGGLVDQADALLGKWLP